MKVGVPTEIKADEYRVALSPSGVRELTDRGHSVCRASNLATSTGWGSLTFTISSASANTASASGSTRAPWAT